MGSVNLVGNIKSNFVLDSLSKSLTDTGNIKFWSTLPDQSLVSRLQDQTPCINEMNILRQIVALLVRFLWHEYHLNNMKDSRCCFPLTSMRVFSSTQYDCYQKFVKTKQLEDVPNGPKKYVQRLISNRRKAFCFVFKISFTLNKAQCNLDFET